MTGRIKIVHHIAVAAIFTGIGSKAHCRTGESVNLAHIIMAICRFKDSAAGCARAILSRVFVRVFLMFSKKFFDWPYE